MPGPLYSGTYYVCFKSIRKALINVITCILTLNIGLCTNIYAATENSVAYIINYEASDVNLNGSNQTDIKASRGSSYVVTIPKQITLDGIDKNCSYNVRVGGDIAGCETVYVIPDESFILHESGGKADSTATVTQIKTSWKYADVWSNNGLGTATEGIVSAPITAGNWVGYFYFNLHLDKEDLTQSASHDVSIHEDEAAISLLRLIDDAEEAELTDPETLAMSFSQQGYTATINEISYVESTEDTEGSYTYTVTLSKPGVQTYTSRQYTRKIPKKGHIHSTDCYCTGLFTNLIDTVTKECVVCDGSGVINQTTLGHRHTDECYGDSAVRTKVNTITDTKYCDANHSYKTVELLDLSGLSAGTTVSIRITCSTSENHLIYLILNDTNLQTACVNGIITDPVITSNLTDATVVDRQYVSGSLPSKQIYILDTLTYKTPTSPVSQSSKRGSSVSVTPNSSISASQDFDFNITFTILQNMPDNSPLLITFGTVRSDATTATAYTKQLICTRSTADIVAPITCSACNGSGIDDSKTVHYYSCDVCGSGRKSDTYYGTKCNKKICGRD